MSPLLPFPSPVYTSWMRRFSTLVAASCVLLAAGCAMDDDEGVASIQIGTGQVEFEPLEDMQDLALVAGPQGGYHFIANARIQALDPGAASMPGLLSNPSTQFFVFREDGTRMDAVAPAHRLGYEATDSDWYELTSGRILEIDSQMLKDDSLLAAFYGARVLLRVEVLDADGISASAETWVVPQAAASQ
jgi:hypothetical protein